MEFVLLNPYLDGKKIASNEKDVNLAAEEIWNDVSSKIKNYIPEFYFTIQNSSDSSLHHFKVNESLENNKVKYSINKLDKKKYHKNDSLLLDEINNVSKLKGGKRRYSDDDDSSSSSDEEDDVIFKFKTKEPEPVLTLNYYPSIYGVRNILLPSFVGTFTPFIKINLPLSNTLVISP